MIKIGILFWFWVWISGIAQGDTYIKGILQFETRYRYGINANEDEVIYEWWFGKNKMTFKSTSWDSYADQIMGNNDWRFTIDLDKKQIIAVNLNKKYFFDVPLSISSLPPVEPDTVDVLKDFQLGGSVKKTGEKEHINNRECVIYQVSEWISYKGNRRYDRDRNLRITQDIPINWRLLTKLDQWIRSFFNPKKSYCTAIDNIKGFVLASNDVLYLDGFPLKLSYRVLKMINQKVSDDIYEIPEGFKRKKKFTLGDLLDIRRKFYVVHYL